MPQIVRPLLALLSLVSLWFLAMVLEAVRVPAWALAMIGAALLANLIVLTASIHRITREQDRRNGDGGLPLRHPDAPPPEGGQPPPPEGGQPSWWPEFEQELWQYLAEHERTAVKPHRVPVGSG